MERVGAVRDQNDLTLMLCLSHSPDNTFVFWTYLKLSCANRLYFYSFCPWLRKYIPDQIKSKKSFSLHLNPSVYYHITGYKNETPGLSVQKDNQFELKAFKSLKSRISSQLTLPGDTRTMERPELKAITVLWPCGLWLASLQRGSQPVSGAHCFLPHGLKSRRINSACRE